jgi:hypothetical protein
MTVSVSPEQKELMDKQRNGRSVSKYFRERMFGTDGYEVIKGKEDNPLYKEGFELLLKAFDFFSENGGLDAMMVWMEEKEADYNRYKELKEELK